MTNFIEFILYKDDGKKIIVNTEQIKAVIEESSSSTIISFPDETYAEICGSYPETIRKLSEVSNITLI